MKYVKLFEEFINEEDPLAGLGIDGGGGGDKEKPKEDPLDKKKKEDEAKEKKAKEKHNEYVDKKKDNIEDILADLPEVDKKIGDKIIKAVKDQDRVKIHNAALDVTYMQQDYQEKGNEKMISKLTPLKTYLDDLDKSYTNDKLM